MTTYLEDEASTEVGSPIELYEFVSNVRSYFYTSFVEDVIFNGDTYEAIPMKRGALQGTAQDDAPVAEINMPFNAQLVQDFAYVVSPRDLDLTIHRYHPESGAGNAVVYWKGAVATVTVTGRIAKIRVPSTLAGALANNIPNVYYQSQCNHVLYGARCGLLASNFDQATTVTNVTDDGLTVVVGSVGGAAADTYKAGEIVRTSDGERRLITSQSTTTLTINYPFPELLGADAVTLFQGCDHTVATCRDKFTNKDNFGGQNLIPNKNIFEIGLK